MKTIGQNPGDFNQRAVHCVAGLHSESKKSESPCMKIVAMETYPARIPIKPERHMISALGRHVVSEFLLVRLLTDQGLEGAGEASITPRWSGETAWGAEAMAQRVLSSAIVGRDPFDIEGLDGAMDQLCAHNWFLKSAIEMACWDIQGKALGKPVYDLLGGPCRGLTVRSRYSMGAYEPDHASRRAKELVALGFTTIKIKVGGKAEADIARVQAVRRAVGHQIALVIDANCGWDAETAIHCVNALEDCQLSLVEQPTPDGDYAAIARVRQSTRPPVMADDMCFNLVHAEELLRNQGCDVISVYPGKNGGIRKSKQICELAARHNVACSIGSNLEWDVATAAMAHLVVSTPNIQVEKFPGDMLGPDYHELRVVKEPLLIKGPLLTLNDRPGLGVEVDWDLVRRHAC